MNVRLLKGWTDETGGSRRSYPSGAVVSLPDSVAGPLIDKGIAEAYGNQPDLVRPKTNATPKPQATKPKEE